MPTDRQQTKWKQTNKKKKNTYIYTDRHTYSQANQIDKHNIDMYFSLSDQRIIVVLGKSEFLR